MKKLVFVIIVLIGIMSSQLIRAEESCGVATVKVSSYSAIIKCKSGRQFSCDSVGGEDGTGWECECDNGPCRGKWNSDLNESAQISCCSAENQIPLSKESNTKSEETAIPTKKIAKEKAMTHNQQIVEGAKDVINNFFTLLDENPATFDVQMAGAIPKMLEQGVKSNNLETLLRNILAAAANYTIFELHIDDELSCALTVQESKTLKDYKIIAYISGGKIALEKMRKLPEIIADSGYKPEAVKEAKKVSDDFFNQTIPVLKKLYMENPNRKHCRR
jgi:hypothetical protein